MQGINDPDPIDPRANVGGISHSADNQFLEDLWKFMIFNVFGNWKHVKSTFFVLFVLPFRLDRIFEEINGLDFPHPPIDLNPKNKTKITYCIRGSVGLGNNTLDSTNDSLCKCKRSLTNFSMWTSISNYLRNCAGHVGSDLMRDDFHFHLHYCLKNHFLDFLHLRH